MEIFPDRTTRIANMTLYVPVLEGNVRKVMPFGRLLVQSPINRDISNFCKQAVVSAWIVLDIRYSYLCELSVSGSDSGISLLKQRNK
jgi:hypothetical protein